MVFIKNQKGAITLLVLVSMLFFVAFLASTYMILSNKAQTQIEMTQQTEKLYNSINATDLYNSYFGDEIIPIYTVEQLLIIQELTVETPQKIQINETGRKNIYFFNRCNIYINE